jgi:uncharacterized protein
MPSTHDPSLADEVRPHYEGVGPCHDWSHACRVAALAVRIADAEGVDARLAHAGGLLHDCGRAVDERHHEMRSAEIAAAVLSGRGWAAADQEPVVAAIIGHRWSKRGEDSTGDLPVDVPAVVADADRLDALGLIGVTRAYLWLGEHGWSRDAPQDWPGRNADALRAHWSEKLQLLAASMRTPTARLLAAQREQAMLTFIEALAAEQSA